MYIGFWCLSTGLSTVIVYNWGSCAKVETQILCINFES